MKQHKIFFNRQQTSIDVRIRNLAEIMQKHGIISSVFVDRFSLTTVKVAENDAPLALRNIEDFKTLFKDDEQQALAEKILNGEITKATPVSKTTPVESMEEN